MVEEERMAVLVVEMEEEAEMAVTVGMLAE